MNMAVFLGFFSFALEISYQSVSLWHTEEHYKLQTIC